MVEQLLPGLLSVVHTALVHVQDEVGPGEPRPHIVGKHWSFPCGHAHGHIMEPHLAHPKAVGLLIQYARAWAARNPGETAIGRLQARKTPMTQGRRP